MHIVVIHSSFCRWKQRKQKERENQPETSCTLSGSPHKIYNNNIRYIFDRSSGIFYPPIFGFSQGIPSLSKQNHKHPVLPALAQQPCGELSNRGQGGVTIDTSSGSAAVGYRGPQHRYQNIKTSAPSDWNTSPSSQHSGAVGKTGQITTLTDQRYPEEMAAAN
jgi:hypothetical protein